MRKPLVTIGRAERIAFPEGELKGVPAKVDTGAYRSAVWATDIYEKDGKLYFKLLGKSNDTKPSKEMSVNSFEVVDVENSFGHTEKRYSVYLSVIVHGRRVRTNFTLADRAAKTYFVLLGRKLLRGKFIVDVGRGFPIPDEELKA